MGRYIIRRLLWVVFLLLIVSAVTFVIFYALPSADPAARFALPRLSTAALPCRVEAALVPRVCDFALVLLRSRVAAPFFAAALRSAFV